MLDFFDGTDAELSVVFERADFHVRNSLDDRFGASQWSNPVSNFLDNTGQSFLWMGVPFIGRLC